jgi:hypothetical protein
MNPSLDGGRQSVELPVSVLGPIVAAETTDVVTNCGFADAECLPNLSVRAALKLESQDLSLEPHFESLLAKRSDARSQF